MDLALTNDGGAVTTITGARGAKTVDLLDVARLGAVAGASTPEAMTHNVNVFASAFQQARATGSQVIARKGQAYWLNKSLRMDGLTFHCEADLWFSDGTPTSTAGLTVVGNAPRLNLSGSINSTATQRGGGSWGQHTITVASAVDFELFGGGLVQGASCVGIHLNGAKRGVVRGLRAANTKADSFHNTNGTEWVEWVDCAAEGGGDDMLSVVSYDTDKLGMTQHITVRRFRGQKNRWARGLTVVGGAHVLFEDCQLSDVNGFGLYVASESSYNTRGVRDVTFRRVLVDGCGYYSDGVGDGLRIYGRSGMCSMGLPRAIDGVVLDGVEIRRPRRWHAYINTTYATNIERRDFTGAVWRAAA